MTTTLSNEAPRIILITRRTRLAELVARHNTVEQARFHAEHLGLDFDDFIVEDRIYRAALDTVTATLERHGRVQAIERAFLPNFLFPPGALVAVLGQDGLVANTLKYLDGQVLLAVNPDPARYDGVLLPFAPKDLARLLPEVQGARRPLKEVVMAEARLSDGQCLTAVNDLFIGARSHVSAQYELGYRDRRERQSSSGVIVSTGLGSTGWLRSVLTGAGAVAGGKLPPRAATLCAHGYGWDEPRLVYTVREPFPSRITRTELAFGDIDARSPLVLRSLMPEGGVIFSDGMQADGLEFRSGMVATIGIAGRRGRLLV